jgi:CubicO group peptidase (beta-lactamase class C family)
VCCPARTAPSRTSRWAGAGPPQPASTPDPDTWIARLGELPLLAQPGDRWLYQSGSQVLGILAARAAGAAFEDVLRSRVFSPLGMDDTGFHAADTARVSTACERRDGVLVVSDPPEGQWSQPPAFPDGSGGLVSSVTVWSNVPLQDLTVVVLTQRAADETGMPAVCDDVLAAARATR